MVVQKNNPNLSWGARILRQYCANTREIIDSLIIFILGESLKSICHDSDVIKIPKFSEPVTRFIKICDED